MINNTEFFNDKYFSFINSLDSIGLANGKMGVCIYLYNRAYYRADPKCKQLADKLMLDISNDLFEGMPLDFENGLLGIGFGVMYMSDKGFIDGDIDEQLDCIDNALFKEFAYLDSNSNFTDYTLMYLLLYLYKRVCKNDALCLKELIIKIFNCLLLRVDDSFLQDSFKCSFNKYKLPLFLFVSSKLLELEICNFKILKTLNDVSFKILYKFPVLNFNRLFLLLSMISVVPYLKDPAWAKYLKKLHESISINDILDDEYESCGINLSSGLSGVYVLFKYINKHDNYSIIYDVHSIYNKIYYRYRRLERTNKYQNATFVAWM